MKRLWYTTLLTTFGIALAVNSVWASETKSGALPTLKNPWFIFGSTPPKEINDWVKLLVLGNRNSLFPIVWVSPQRFKLSGFPERLIVLPRKDYREFVKFISVRGCSKARPTGSVWGTLEISHHSKDRTEVVCVLPQKAACPYLADIMDKIVTTKERRAPISDLRVSIGCS
jgi:hypothetical protein